ncbi:uncharacterized protein C8Q71DRAFT_746208 [Rhodofomes roseus]|uniref:DUF6589 domain-containing protein n=1 Tax=Rhodofomes roseus TaxID=34475 RepID=A0ABQ8KPW9_9APHY|nr:uncharacterized protein C8Q71DRAFT_746208 [Rhodofomes roseus]KAH9840190.1 hypothetical protein C8Q71DRAFT_746208 [Rhodofomes roseus]
MQRRAKGLKQRNGTLRQQREDREHRHGHDLAAANTSFGTESNASSSRSPANEDGPQVAAASRRPREEVLDEVLSILRAEGYTWGDLVLYLSDPASKRGDERYEGMFDILGRIEQVLTYWTSSRNSPTGRQAVHVWALDYVEKAIRREGTRATKDGVLQSRKMVVDDGFLSRFNLSKIYDRLTALCPIMTSLLREFSTTARQRRLRTNTSAHRNDLRVGTALMGLLAERSQQNSYGRHVLGLYLYATGAQRQCISILSHLGICSSYTAIAGTPGSRTAAMLKSQVNGAEDSSDEESEKAEGSDSGSESESSSESSSDNSTSSGEVEGARSMPVVPQLQSVRDPDGIDEEEPDEGIQGSDISLAAELKRLGAGLLRRLSEACRWKTRALALAQELAHVYDNINWILRAAEQTVGHKDSIENGTCATVFPLHDAPRTAMRTTDFLHAFETAPPLSLDDILLDPTEMQTFNKMLEHAVLRIIVSNGGPAFARFTPDVDESLVSTSECIVLRKTEVYPLRAMNIEEASIKGNAEVMEAMFRELGHDLESTAFTETVKLVFGDQLSVARLRAVISNRAGHDSLSQSMLFAAFAPGFFHYQMAATYGFLETHWGNPHLGHHDPACLSWHNTVLDRKPFLLTNRPPYRVARDLIFHSLYGRLIHCLELVTGCDSLDEYAENVTFEDLQAHVTELVSRFVSASVVSQLRSARTRELLTVQRDNTSDPDAQPHVPRQGDMVFENASLFLRDALILREFADAIKAGDSGRIVIVLKVLALSYRGSGRTKYAQEALHVIHNLTHVWPKPLRAIILNNWLVNTTGKPNHWYPVDLLQEHNIFWTKTIYNAQGSGASWDWLEMISPCINSLRHLVTSMNDALGSRLGTTHAAPDLRRDIEELRRSLTDANVYKVTPGRTIDGDKAVVPNVITSGVTQLAGPLREYNAMFARMKKRRRRTSPLVGGANSASAARVHSTSGGSAAVHADADEDMIDVEEMSDCEDGEDEEEVDDTEHWLEHEQFFTLDEEGDVDPYLD